MASWKSKGDVLCPHYVMPSFICSIQLEQGKVRGNLMFEACEIGLICFKLWMLFIMTQHIIGVWSVYCNKFKSRFAYFCSQETIELNKTAWWLFLANNFSVVTKGLHFRGTTRKSTPMHFQYLSFHVLNDMNYIMPTDKNLLKDIIILNFGRTMQLVNLLD